MIVNATAAPCVVRLEAPRVKIKGAQDPKTNDGKTVDSVELPARDGVILLKPTKSSTP